MTTGSATGTADFQSKAEGTVVWTDTITISGSTSPVQLELIGVTQGPYTIGNHSTLGYFEGDIDGYGVLTFVNGGTTGVRKASAIGLFDPSVAHTVNETTDFICAVSASKCSYQIKSRLYIVPMEAGITISSASGISYALPQ